jgi:excisionase family DNA binding protein
MEQSETVFLTVAEVAARLGVSPARVYQLIAAGVVPAVRLSPRRVRIPRAAFAAWAAAWSAEALAGVAHPSEVAR